jgi:RNA polymerase sigma-70 factor
MRLTLERAESTVDEGRSRFLGRYLAVQPAVRAYALAVLRDIHAAEDALQETALAAWAEIGRYDESRPFEAWILGIARNKCADLLRARERHPVLPDDVLGELARDAAALAAEGAGRRQALSRCLEMLGAGARELVRLRFEEELGAAEISGRLGRSLAAVRKGLARARAFLMDCGRAELEKGVG